MDALLHNWLNIIICHILLDFTKYLAGNTQVSMIKSSMDFALIVAQWELNFSIVIIIEIIW